MKTMRSWILGSALIAAGCVVAHAPPAAAAVAVGVAVGLPLRAPPAARVERVVVRPGHVWIPGYWRWSGGRYAWVGGHAVVARPGWRWHPVRWEACGRHWCRRAGYWGK